MAMMLPDGFLRIHAVYIGSNAANIRVLWCVTAVKIFIADLRDLPDDVALERQLALSSQQRYIHISRILNTR